MSLIKLKQYFCKHNFISLNDEKYIGETANFALKLYHGFESTYKCTKCNKQIKKKYIYWFNFKNIDGSINHDIVKQIQENK